MMADLWQDVRYAARLLAKEPLFAFTAVLTLALAIGANTAIFSVVNAVLLRPLPYRDPERLISIPTLSPSGDRQVFFRRDLESFRSRTQTLEAVAMVMTQSVNLTGGDRPERIRGAFVSANLFDVFQIQPLIGRTFAPDEDRPGGARLAVVSERWWRSRMNGDSALGSRTLTLNGEPYQVIGVVPSDFKEPYDPDVDVWMPVFAAPYPDARDLYGLGYLRPGIELSQARAEAATIARQIAAENPKENAGWSATLDWVREVMVARSRPMLWAAFATETTPDRAERRPGGRRSG
jgi:putative ABC transport system permease protein